MDRRTTSRVALIAGFGVAVSVVAASMSDRALAREGAAPAPPCATADHDFQRALAARRSNGFNDDAAYVRSTICRYAAAPSRIGTPITPEEDQELTRRDGVGARLSTLDATLAVAGPHSFVGSWVDPAAGGVATFAYLPGTTPDLSAIRNSLPAGTPVTTVDGVISAEDQQARNTVIDDNFAGWWSRGIRLLSYNTSRLGVLEIYLDPRSATGAEDDLVRALGSAGLDVRRMDPAVVGAGPQVARTDPTARTHGESR